MKKKIIFLILVCLVFNIVPAFAATVIKKEDAALFSKKSIYSDIDVKEQIVSKDGGDNDSSYDSRRDDAADRFTAVTASKVGNTYTNTWSDYTVTFDDPFLSANDVYDFYAEGVKFDFGIYFKDYSRVAIYYSRLSKDLNVVAANFAPGNPVTDVIIGEYPYKHVSEDVQYPYGIEKYDYYLRDVDGKLMIIELYWEDKHDICKKYIEKFAKAK